MNCGNVKTARNSYFTEVGSPTTEFDDTLTEAIETYYNTMLEAQITRSQSHYNASKTHYDALESAMNAYNTAAFNAAKTASLAYLDAAIKEAKDNANDAEIIYKREFDYYTGIISTFEDTYGGMFATPTYAAAAIQAHTDALTHKNTTYIATEITAKETFNEGVKDTADAKTAKDYKNAENYQWVIYVGKTILADASWLVSYALAEMTFKSAKSAADNAYELMVIPALVQYLHEIDESETLYLAAVAHAGDANFNVANYFAGGVSGNQGDFQFVTMNQPPGWPGQSQQGPVQGPQPEFPKPPVPAIGHVRPGGQVFGRFDGSGGFMSDTAEEFFVLSEQGKLKPPPQKEVLDSTSVLPQELVPPSQKDAPLELQPHIALQKMMQQNLHVTVPDKTLSKFFTPKDFALKYINPNAGFFASNWGFASADEKDNTYAQGCVGIATVILGENNRTWPAFHPNATWFRTYSEAFHYYNASKENGNDPILILYANSNDLEPFDSITGFNSDSFFFGLKMSIECSLGYDFCTLVKIDIGNGEQACWLHATAGWINNKNNGVVVSPVEGYHENRRAVFIVVENSVRAGLGFKTTFDIPDIPSGNLPPSFDSFMINGKLFFFKDIFKNGIIDSNFWCTDRFLY